MVRIVSVQASSSSVAGWSTVLVAVVILVISQNTARSRSTRSASKTTTFMPSLDTVFTEKTANTSTQDGGRPTISTLS